MGAYHNAMRSERDPKMLLWALEKEWSRTDELTRAMPLVPLMLTDVERFNLEIVGVDVPDVPTMLTGHRLTHTSDHLHEELSEFEEAENLEDQADALVDLVYVALGRLVEMGVPPGPAFNAVHEANMRKVAGSVSKRPNSGGKDAVKPKDWKAPDLAPILSITGDDVERVVRARAEVDTCLDVSPRPAMHDAEELCGRSTKVLVIGHARHGKDTVGKILRDMYGMRFTSSSHFCADEVVMPHLAPLYGYKTGEECFEDRGNHRKEWYDLIRAYNSPDAAALGRALFERNDVYVGLRSKTELNALLNSGVVDHIIWVDRSDHVGPESADSCTVEPWMAHWTVDNNGSLEDLAHNVSQLMRRLLS